MSGGLPTGRAVAVVVARGGVLPGGADEAVAEAGGLAVVVGSGAEQAAGALVAAARAWWAETGPGLRPAALAAALAPFLAGAPLVVLPHSMDGRDLAPRLAAALDRPLLAYATRVTCGDGVHAELSRLDDRLTVPVSCAAPAVATLVPGARAAAPVAGAAPVPLDLPPLPIVADAEVVAVLEPDPATMDLADATRVIGGGGGLVPRGADDDEARGLFDLLARVAARLGASAGATRVATDAGWIGYDRQIGTTGITVTPELYVALGVSGAGQHTGGLGAPRHVVSVNLDPSAPMTAMADLGLVTDAGALLLELARRLEVAP